MAPRVKPEGDERRMAEGDERRMAEGDGREKESSDDNVDVDTRIKCEYDGYCEGGMYANTGLCNDGLYRNIL